MEGLIAIALSYLAGLAMPAGALLANVENISPHWLERELRHSIIAFGGGALLSAVALVLVPEGTEHLNVVWAPLFVCLGAIALLGLDRYLSKNDTPIGQLVAMLTDFLPESLALGAAMATGGSSGPVIALMIGLQNLPEGFNAFREMRSSTRLSTKRLLGAFNLMALLGPASAAIGFYLLAPQTEVVAAVELFAAGGILYLIFQDIAPQVKLEKAWAPPFGAVLGFVLGLIGHMISQG